MTQAANRGAGQLMEGQGSCEQLEMEEYDRLGFLLKLDSKLQTSLSASQRFGTYAPHCLSLLCRVENPRIAYSLHQIVFCISFEFLTPVACRASHQVRKLFRGRLQARLSFSPDDCHLPQLWTDASGQGTDVSQMLPTAAGAMVELRSVTQLYRAHSALGREKSKEAKVEGQAVVTITDLDSKEVRAAVSQQKRMKDGGFSKPAPMFLDDSFRKWARIREFVPPFGIKGQDNLIKAILSVTKEYRLTPALDSLHCRRCIIVGNGGVLANKSLGSRIDDYDIVVRLNSAPVKGFERDVGSKTTLRITYPEGAMQRPEQYERDSLFVLAGFKWQDFKWLKYIVYKERVSASDGFWKSVATRVPKEPPEIRILNPYFIQEAAFTLIGLPFNNGLMGRGNIPTLGSVAVTMALHGCDEVAVAGFGYDMNTPNAPLHYYETVRMAAIKESWTHNIQREKEFLRKLVKARVITDLTSGI
ncbi:CMP-N-acetylneuraminate-beta-1,4-galactoside alpha-2,3-sialyltransferase [Microtus ochrogaster]|uniref:CMP-N-acetylneuraminate-beta-1,4-galactoside alpha-2,3-sialyltransferase n=1 Tax=Microtus ochrogaster TaxID=79684 RepID=A0A8J6KJY9_MICOH|nr:CMP-N-acetylneuraminate-beta-1,4-galactoside alpha-2,3-sialyltransferase [Microtus ochrogaster]